MRTITREIVGCYLISSDNCLLLGRSKPGGVYPGFDMIPGGGVDKGETKVDAVRREVLEEVGTDISKYEPQLVNDSQHGESQKTLRDTGEQVLVKMQFNDYRVMLDQPAATISTQADDDFTAIIWVPLADLKNHKFTEPTKDTMRKLGYL